MVNNLEILTGHKDFTKIIIKTNRGKLLLSNI
jgi:hypothetical protein